MALLRSWGDKCALPSKAQVKEVIDGCNAECDKKCVIDNHEVEILQGAVEQGEEPERASFFESCRAELELCTPGRPPSVACGGDESARSYRPRNGCGSGSERAGAGAAAAAGRHATSNAAGGGGAAGLPRSDSGLPESLSFG
eukprot:TRINITY_DN60783_c0_g1_i1.p2 TRINITY_DN60783_c0_g1~~TRINITY_DN60783_c0_g1_i1.p2  ORF type:complete len:142 (-),score=35.99 TRINITY_DN60783_c0_g1_i1:163-588(-)